jgi:isoleucyl-tRNA synthetase
VWTTTPWTLVSNAAVAVDPELTYVRAKAGPLEAPVVLAELLVEHVLGSDGVQILARFPGAALDGVRYEAPFPFLKSDVYGERGHTVLLGDFVTADDGTGLVHTAIAFGVDDFRLGQQYGLNVVNPVRLDATYDERIGPYAGRKVQEANSDLIEDLRARGRLLRAETIEHAYPHCWRSGDPLIYYAKRSWYIATSKLRDNLIEANSQVAWHPEHIRDGRMGDWLRGNVDWALSRERYWGTPLPVWRCSRDGEHTHVVGSLGELEELSGVRLEDPHRPFVDEVGFPCPQCGARMERVPEVIDVWFDSGSMPFAQYHAPFENEERFQARKHANFICEAIDQTRGWFYSLLAISVLLFDRSPYETVVCLGLILDADGQKMSKSKGNIVVPWDVIDRFGADAFRWYFFTAKNPWDAYRFNVETIGDSIRLFLRQLWNTYAFLSTYEPEHKGEHTDLDRWILSRLAATVEEVIERMDAFDATTAGRGIAEFVDDLSNWYVRGSRRRFWEGDGAAFTTLETALVTVAKLLAPFTPFVADELYDNLDGSEPSVHLCEWPEPGDRDIGLEDAMAVARETVRLGLSARAAAKVKLRQPLKEAVVVAVGREREGIERLADIVRDQLNVKELRFVQAADELGAYEVKPNYRALGPRFGKAMPQVAAAVAALDPTHVSEALRQGHPIGIAVDGHDHELGADDLLLAMAPLEGYQLEREGSHAVALELALDAELRREGLAREVVHAVQNARKAAGLAVEDRIRLVLSGDDELVGAAQAHEEYLAREVLAVEVVYDGAHDGALATIEDRELRIALARA